jgi:hypothetical protein
MSAALVLIGLMASLTSCGTSPSEGQKPASVIAQDARNALLEAHTAELMTTTTDSYKQAPVTSTTSSFVTFQNGANGPGSKGYLGCEIDDPSDFVYSNGNWTVVANGNKFGTNAVEIQLTTQGQVTESVWVALTGPPYPIDVLLPESSGDMGHYTSEYQLSNFGERAPAECNGAVTDGPG